MGISRDVRYNSGIERRLMAGSRSAGALNKLLIRNDMSRNIKVALYKMMIRPVGCRRGKLSGKYLGTSRKIVSRGEKPMKK